MTKVKNFDVCTLSLVNLENVGVLQSLGNVVQSDVSALQDPR